jgi:hypothetical protein
MGSAFLRGHLRGGRDHAYPGLRCLPLNFFKRDTSRPERSATAFAGPQGPHKSNIERHVSVNHGIDTRIWIICISIRDSRRDQQSRRFGMLFSRIQNSYSGTFRKPQRWRLINDLICYLSHKHIADRRLIFGMCADPVQCWIGLPVASYSGPFAYPCQTIGPPATSSPRRLPLHGDDAALHVRP